jgi:hypothetical protein
MLLQNEWEQARLLAKTSAAGMFARPLPNCINKCVSTKVAKIAQIESRTQACLSMTEMQAMTQSVKIAQIESRAQACLSMTEMQAMTQSVHNVVISYFE